MAELDRASSPPPIRALHAVPSRKLLEWPSPQREALASALARAVVTTFRAHTGRGPTKARAIVRDAVMVVVLQDVFTPGERRLVASGQASAVADLRQAFQAAMDGELRRAVEELTGRRVLAVLGDTSVEDDVSCEVFVLDAPVPRAGAT